MLPHHDGLEVPVGLHELPGGGQVLSDALRVAVQVHAEQVEGVPADLGHVVEELPGRAARFAAEHVVAAAAEHDGRGRVGLLDRGVHGVQLVHVFGRAARPEQVGIARLVVTLPVADPAGRSAERPGATNSGVRALIEGRRRGRKSVGCAGPPRRARAQRDPQLLIAVQLAQQGVHRVPAVVTGLRLDLRPEQVGPHQPGPESASLRHELPGRPEQAVADAAHHAQPDSPRFECAGSTIRGSTVVGRTRKFHS